MCKAGTPFPITGVDGRKLAEEWSNGAYAYKSVSVSGYPNLFFTFGPNSGPGHNSALVYLEAEIRYIVDAIGIIIEGGIQTFDVKEDRQNSYHAQLQRRLAGTTWNSGCKSWYLTEDGYNGTMYPGFTTQFARQLARVELDDYSMSSQPSPQEAQAGAARVGRGEFARRKQRRTAAQRRSRVRRQARRCSFLGANRFTRGSITADGGSCLSRDWLRLGSRRQVPGISPR